MGRPRFSRPCRVTSPGCSALGCEERKTQRQLLRRCQRRRGRRREEKVRRRDPSSSGTSVRLPWDPAPGSVVGHREWSAHAAMANERIGATEGLVSSCRCVPNASQAASRRGRGGRGGDRTYTGETRLKTCIKGSRTFLPQHFKGAATRGPEGQFPRGTRKQPVPLKPIGLPSAADDKRGTRRIRPACPGVVWNRVSLLFTFFARSLPSQELRWRSKRSEVCES